MGRSERRDRRWRLTRSVWRVRISKNWRIAGALRCASIDAKIRRCANWEAQRSDRASRDGIAMIDEHLAKNPTD
jgi:hypothetical protein